MTISNTPRRAGPYRGDGSTVDYPFAFRIFATNDLRVYVAGTDGNERGLATGEYTVTADIAAQPTRPGGSIRLRTPLPTGHLLTIITSMEYIQPTEFTNSGGFYPRVLNDSLDRLTIYVQQLAEIQNRSLVGTVTGDDTPRSAVEEAVQAARRAQSTAQSANSTAASALSEAAAAKVALTTAQTAAEEAKRMAEKNTRDMQTNKRAAESAQQQAAQAQSAAQTA